MQTKAIFLWHPFQGKLFRQLGDVVEVVDGDRYEERRTMELPQAVKEYDTADVYYGRFDEFFGRDPHGTITMKSGMDFLKGERYEHGTEIGHIFRDKLS